jgi:hypothetical protein
MLVQWTCLEDSKQSVKWGFSPGNYAHSQLATSQTYTRQDMCGGVAGSYGWWDPGFQLRATITGIDSQVPGNDVVYYVVGSDATGWTAEASFKAPQPVGANQAVNLLITADVGALEPDNFISIWSGPNTQEQQVW